MPSYTHPTVADTPKSNCLSEPDISASAARQHWRKPRTSRTARIGPRLGSYAGILEGAIDFGQCLSDGSN